MRKDTDSAGRGDPLPQGDPGLATRAFPRKPEGAPSEAGNDLAEELAVTRGVARIVTWTLGIDEVFEKFAAEMKRLVDFDQVDINIADQDAFSLVVKYPLGQVLLRRRSADTTRLKVPRPQQSRQAGRPHRDRKSTRLNSSHIQKSRMPSSA